MNLTTTKERPILFSGSMVRAILENRKTETRRIAKFQPAEPDSECRPAVGRFAPLLVDRHGNQYPGQEIFGAYGDDWHLKCPFGAPGNRLWVKESWFANDSFDDLSPNEIEAGSTDAGYNVTPDHPACCLWYDADGHYRQWADTKSEKGRRRVSIHMPRWASRINLDGRQRKN